jgi:hypothetical protein
MYKNNFQILTLCGLFSPHLFYSEKIKPVVVWRDKGLFLKRAVMQCYSIFLLFASQNISNLKKSFS